jgi:hypothetical protein
MDPASHCITRWTAIPFTVYDFGKPGSWITWVIIACVFTVTVSSRCEVEQSVFWQVDALPSEHWQATDEVVVIVRFEASFEAAVAIPVESCAV